jgi:muramoyltetrapeptide carboxypeptidase
MGWLKANQLNELNQSNQLNRWNTCQQTDALTLKPVNTMAYLNDKPIRPPRLKRGDTIGIVAPASPFDPKIFFQGLHILESMGFQARVPEEIFEKNGYLAGSDEHRAGLVMRLFEDQSVDALVCAKGGFGSLRILPLLDFEVIRQNPKVFLGHSDITALLATVTARSGLVTFHGPLLTTLVKAPETSCRSLLTAISSSAAIELKPTHGVALKAGRASGRMIGGNLTTLCHMLATPFEPRFENRILLLEDRGEAHYRIDRMLFQMKLAGCFKRIAGLILGSFEACGSLDGVFKIFEEHFKDIPAPILAGFDLGHGQQNLTLPFGLEATLDADKQILAFDQAATVG